MRASRAAAGAVVALALGAAPALFALHAAAAPSIKIVGAHVGGQPITGSTRDHPVKIDPRVRTALSMTLLNRGTETVHVRYLRLSGAVIGIHFVNYQGSTNVDIAPGETKVVATPGDFFDVDGVATGYVNGNLQAVDELRSPIASQSFVGDVRGKLASSEGLFFLELVALAVISLVDIGFGVARRRLPRNRFISGVLFAFAAASVVLTIVVGAAMARIALFDVAAWLPTLMLTTAAAFFLGYTAPGRLTRTAPELAEDRVIELVAADAVARASGEHERRTTGGGISHASGDHSEIALTAEPPSHHDSGEFTAPTQHRSGGHEPLA